MMMMKHAVLHENSHWHSCHRLVLVLCCQLIGGTVVLPTHHQRCGDETQTQQHLADVVTLPQFSRHVALAQVFVPFYFL